MNSNNSESQLSKPQVIVLGSINTDLVVRTANLPAPGETVTGGTFSKESGGKGANQAVAAARLSENPVLFIAAVGDDPFGRESLESLSTENIDCQYIKTIPNTPSGIALINVDQSGENSISVASGANFEITPEDIESIDDSFFENATVFLTSLETPLPAVIEGLKKAKKHGLKTILNPAPANLDILSLEILPDIDLLTPNEHELAFLSGFPVDSEEDAALAGRYLIEQGVRLILCTRGKEGALWIDETGSKSIPPFKVEPIDTTAAGDAFNGAIATFFSEGVESIEASRLASAVAAIAVTKKGAQNSLPSRSELETFLKDQ
jgi:ribokinase